VVTVDDAGGAAVPVEGEVVGLVVELEALGVLAFAPDAEVVALPVPPQPPSTAPMKPTNTNATGNLVVTIATSND
jgi:hypothetical protein